MPMTHTQCMAFTFVCRAIDTDLSSIALQTLVRQVLLRVFDFMSAPLCLCSRRLKWHRQQNDRRQRHTVVTWTHSNYQRFTKTTMSIVFFRRLRASISLQESVNFFLRIVLLKSVCAHTHTTSVINKKLSYRRDSAGRRSLRRSGSFKVTDVNTNRKPVCALDFLLVNNTNLQPISHRLQVIFRLWSNFPFDRGYLFLTHTHTLRNLASRN